MGRVSVGSGFEQDARMRIESVLQRLTELMQQVPAIGDLNSLRRRLSCGFCVDTSAITAYDFSSGLLLKQRGYGLGLAVCPRRTAADTATQTPTPRPSHHSDTRQHRHGKLPKASSTPGSPMSQCPAPPKTRAFTPTTKPPWPSDLRPTSPRPPPLTFASSPPTPPRR